ncbi:MAG: hypothetical protein KME28_09285 [Pelatocladus maniniholoensis HA4357-MV3]|jgi:hypothetical protein|uniref:Uncharacterized protein n=1 Tax=Pelatocladus maniniholoensis HA4357-MV3 TaxID=1117104 RepID=A0A9E3H6X2_9NOST|nr:hypothetical protein [Pelatocladus maniniholoensis HA4357-MV3]
MQTVKPSQQFWIQFTEKIWEKETFAIQNSFINLASAVNRIPTVVPLYPNIQTAIKTINSGEIQSVKIILEDSYSLVNKEDSREDSDEVILGFLNLLLDNDGIKIVQ